MTVMLAEAAPAAAGASSAAGVSGAGAGSATAAGAGAGAGNVSRGTSGQQRSTKPRKPRSRRKTSGTRTPAPQRPQATSGKPKHRKQSPATGNGATAWSERQLQSPPPTVILNDGRYRRIILAEFVACVVIVGATPFMTPRAKDQSPEQAAKALALSAPMTRLTAVCVVFFVLALLAGGARTGKIAAAFGGLVTVGALVNATDMLKGLSAVFTSGASTQSPTPAPAPAGTVTA